MKDKFKTGTPDGEPLLSGKYPLVTEMTTDSCEAYMRVDPEIHKKLDRIEGMLRVLLDKL